MVEFSSKLRDKIASQIQMPLVSYSLKTFSMSKTILASAKKGSYRIQLDVHVVRYFSQSDLVTSIIRIRLRYFGREQKSLTKIEVIL
jgi:hypothetical protein